MTETIAPSQQLEQLRSFLLHDPKNPSLLRDTASAALDAREPGVARELLDRLGDVRPANDDVQTMRGIAALQERDYAAAEALFAGLHASHPDDPALAFNLAWALANQQAFARALEILTDSVARTMPQAATLRIELLHQLGALAEARPVADAYAELFPDHQPLFAAISVLAIDLEDKELAASSAARAGEHPDALTTLGTLALGQERASEAAALFERALAANPAAPRAWVGSGLSKLLTGQNEAAPADLDRGAEMFGDHLGSWIAAGWSHFIAGDRATARLRFERALALDDTFAEAHGSLAVVDLLDGHVEAAERECEVALRLDRTCFSAALARTMLLSAKGDHEHARRIYERALGTPVDGDGRTIAQALATMGLA